MSHFTEYQFERSSPVAGLLEMIERCAPRFMRGSVGEGTSSSPARVTPEAQERMESAVLRGVPRKVIANEMNLAYGTICQRTQHLRGKEGSRR